MNLKQLIEYLEKKDRDIIVPVGFDKPRLCIGDYTCLAFEPAGDVTVGAMLQCARSAVGTTYRNWLDDEYQMHGGTEVYLAMSGCVGEKIGGVLLDYMTGVYDDEEIKNLHSVINKSTDEIEGLIAERDHTRTDLAFADDTIHDLTVERNNIRQQLIDANRVLSMFQDEIKENDCRIDRLTKERHELNHLFLNDRGTLRSIERICDKLGMRDPQFISRDVQAIKSMRMISNIMEGWDPNVGREKEFDDHLNEAIELLVGEIPDQNTNIEKLKEDSAVLMKVVDAIRDWDDSTGRAFPTLYKIVDLLVDYIDVPEGDYDDGNIQKK